MNVAARINFTFVLSHAEAQMDTYPLYSFTPLPWHPWLRNRYLAFNLAVNIKK